MKEDLTKKIQELQSLEQNLQSLLMNKQNVQLELNEIDNALSELGSTEGEVYKILSGIMIKASKEEVTKELNEKKKVISLRISTIEKQEQLISGKVDKLREDISKNVDKS